MPLSDVELLALCRNLETSRVERKATFTKRDSASIRRTICAFANDLPFSGLPGLLLFGVADDGTLSGVEAKDDALRDLRNFALDGSLRPPPSVEIEARSLDGRTVILMWVHPVSTPPASWDGSIWVRVGPSTQRATREDERILNERRRAMDLPFDATAAKGASIEDLDRLYFEEEFLPFAASADVLEENDRDYSAKLSAQKLLTPDGMPTVAGLLVCGRHPRHFLECAYVQFVWYDGREVDSKILEQAEISGRLAEVVMTIEGKLRIANRSPMDRSGTLHEVKPWVPEVAMQEVFRNALLHRSYEATNAPVRVTWFCNRLEIQSPGGPYGAAARATSFGELTDYRNPVLAGCMKPLRLAEKHGTGIRRAQLAMRKNGNKPVEFDTGLSHVCAVLRFADAS